MIILDTKKENKNHINILKSKGEVISIIGHSGCGKSTVLNMVAGLIPVTLGGIILESKEVVDPGPDRAVVFKHHVYYLGYHR